MLVYNAPLEEFRLLLDALDYASVHALPPYTEYSPDTVLALLEQAGQFCRDVALPLNRTGDLEGVRLDPETGSVTMPAGFKELYRGYVDNGFGALGHDPAWGGGGAPRVVCTMLNELVTATNKSFSMCPGLTQGLIESISHHGSQEQKERYLQKLITGEWTGTMCLTEPQCGTDLGLLTTRAVPEGDHYRLTGNKIWITFGEHDLAENIVHLVLARLPDAPPGIKGISVFAVPKFLPDGTRNGARCTGLEHKMGIHASPTCVLSLEDAWGELVGEPHRGMRAMFTMMNVARLNVGLEGIALGDIAYQSALSFARERRQGRAALTERREPKVSADTILVHPDVRRMLLEIKSTQEPLRALALFTSMKIDLANHHPDAAAREQASGLAALLTPVVKSYGTERGVHNVSLAMQVCGGTGFTRDGVVEQYYRDLRIAMIYEGTNGIQALDLAGRKLSGDEGRAWRDWCALAHSACERSASNPLASGLAEELTPRLRELDALAAWLRGADTSRPLDGEDLGGAAASFLEAFALVALGHQWLLMLEAAGRHGEKVARVKESTARYFFRHVLPRFDSLARVARLGKGALMELAPEDF